MTTHSEQESAEGRKERRELTSRAGIVAAGTLTSRVLGLVREQVLAGAFTRVETDIFFFAFLIPNLLRQLFAEGAVQSAVTPVLSAVRRTSGDEAAKEVFRQLRGLSLLLLVLVTALGVVFAPELVELFAAGYTSRHADYERTVTLTRWVFPYIFFMGTAALGSSALNTAGRFVVTSFAPGLFNVSFVACALALPAALLASGYDPLLALAAGVLLGGALQVVAQWPSLSAIGFLSAPGTRFRDPHVQDVLRRMGPVMFGVGVYYLDVLVARRLLSHYEVGALTYFSFAMRLCDFPQGIFVMALQVATLPSLSRLATLDDKSEFKATFAYGMRLSLFVGVPASVLLASLAQPLTILIFERGAFDRVASLETASSLVAQAAGIWTVACVRQLVAAYYALGDTRTPVIVSALDFLAFLGLATWLGPRYEHVGISLAVTGASLLQMLLLWASLRKRVGGLGDGAILFSALKTLLATAPGVGAAAVVLGLTRPLLDGGSLARLVPGLSAALTFGGVFLCSAWLLRSEELRAVVAPLRRRRSA